MGLTTPLPWGHILGRSTGMARRALGLCDIFTENVLSLPGYMLTAIPAASDLPLNWSPTCYL